MRPAQKRKLAASLLTDYRVPIQRVCEVICLQRSCWYYKPHRRDDSAIRHRIKEIAQVRVRYGYQRIHVLLRREGWRDNKKRVYRVYCEEGLHLRSKRPRRNRAASHRLERLQLSSINQSWSMDFVADQLFDGKKIQALTVVDNYRGPPLRPSVLSNSCRPISKRGRCSEYNESSKSRTFICA